MAIQLDNVSETLWIPLFGKAIESKRPYRLINDKKAVEIANKACEIDPTLHKWWKGLSLESQALMIWRNEAIDKFVNDFISKFPNGTIVNLGAGLCTRYERLNNDKITWIELDLPQVKEVWNLFNEETTKHQYWTDNIFEEKWIQKIKQISSHNVLFIAEGLFMYFSEAEVKSIFKMIISNLSNSFMILEGYSKFVLKRPHPDVRKTEAKKFKNPWGIKTGKDFEKWFPEISHIEDLYFLENKKALRRAPFIHQVGSFLPIFKKAGKIVYLRLT